jgi:hypothetical protein
MKQSKFSRVILFLLIISPLLSGCAHNAKIKSDLYTAVNLWYQQKSRMYCINYQTGEILPAGTNVYDVEVITTDSEEHDLHYMGLDQGPYITFRTVEAGKVFNIIYQPKFHPERTIYDYLKLLFSNKPFDAMTEGMTETEIESIKGGVVVKGMSREAVIMAIGVPSDHKTPSLESDTWHFWKSRFAKRSICFDADGKAEPCKK